MSNLDELLNEAVSAISQTENLQQLDHWRVYFLGKKGKLTESLKSLGNLSPEERPLLGQKVNVVKDKIKTLIDERTESLQNKEIESLLNQSTIDVTLPGRKQSRGSIHPISRVRARIETLFSELGFNMMEGPEIEDDYHNFVALNIPPLHPARALQDTFYFTDGTLLRTHMSPVQIRTMEQSHPPFRMIAMGRVYRKDFDLTHTPMFHQLEGLMIDKNVSFADLKGTLTHFLNSFFEKNLPIRFRASYFPFTEPSAEVDIQCQNCEGRGCRICKESGWLEILGCGMVHPNVLKAVNVDSQLYSGWAFGLGLDRLAMLRYGITDLRTLFENDIRFLRQF